MGTATLKSVKSPPKSVGFLENRISFQKRIQQHHLCSRPFLRYFAASKRVVRISVPEAATNVISTVASIMLDFGFTEQRKPGRVVLFGTGKPHALGGNDEEPRWRRRRRTHGIS